MTDKVLEALRDMQGKTEDAIKTVKSDAAKVDEAITENLGTVFEMAKANGVSVQEIRDAQSAASAKLDELTQNVTKGFEEQGEFSKSLDALNATLTSMKQDGNFLGVVDGSETPNAELKQAALTHYQKMHFHIHSTDKGSPTFEAKSVDTDKIKEYAIFKSAIAKQFRADISGQSAVLSPEESKAISTSSHDDQMFLPTEISNQVLSCFTEESSFLSQFDNVNMGGHRLVFPVEPAEGVYAKWTCEIDCSKEDTDLQQWGNVELVAKDLRATACLTGTMVRDSAIDIESRLAAVARRSFETAITRDYFSSNPAGGMEGLFTKGNHVTVETAETGQIKYIDLVKLAASFPSRFGSGAQWVFNCNTSGYIYTMTDSTGRPLFDLNASNILGFGVTKVDQMPGVSVDGTAVTAGVKAIGLVNPREHYVFARREDFRASRNPFRKQHCNLIEWYFSMSGAGAVKCPNAARMLKVKEA